MDFCGKKVIVTGGAVRIGAAIVRAFASKGAEVVIHCRDHREEGEELLRELPGKGHGLFICDLSDPANTEKMRSVMAGSSVLVNNASCFIRNPIEKESPEDMQLQFAVNFASPVLLMKLFAEVCRENAVIVNMLDQGISHADSSAFSYALSKKALAEATRAAALSYAPKIRVNGIAPGPMIPPPDLPFSRMEKTIPKMPLQRTVAVEDVVSACLFAAGNESITGAILYVDCGLSLT